jgi:hypothetical protein
MSRRRQHNRRKSTLFGPSLAMDEQDDIGAGELQEQVDDQQAALDRLAEQLDALKAKP